MRKFMTVLTLVILPLTAAHADDIPPDLVGQWAVDGQCGDATNTIEITGDTLAMGDGEPMAIVYYPDDSPSGNGAIHWAEEGNVDNFERDADGDRLLYNPQGYGMGVPPTIYLRCN